MELPRAEIIRHCGFGQGFQVLVENRKSIVDDFDERKANTG
jgi:hypothetical protein